MSYLSPGNAKVACPTWSLPAVTTCKPDLQCHRYCYAKDAERRWSSPRLSRARNYVLSRRSEFTLAMAKEVLKSKASVVHVHESGDFYSEAYILKWYTICEFNPDVTFYAYTKRDDLFLPSLIGLKPKNLILIYSWDGIRSSFWWDGAIRNDYDFKTQDDEMKRQGFDNVIYVTDQESTCNFQAHNKEEVKCMDGCRKCITSFDEPLLIKRH